MDPVDRPPYTTHRAPPRRLSVRATTARIAALAAVASLVIWGVLSLQMAAGRDPALGPKDKQASGAQPRTGSTMTGSAPTTVAPTAPAPVQTSTS